MKRLLALACLAASPAFALDCSMMLKVWHGNLGGLSNVSLNIHQPNSMEDAEIGFSKDGGHIGFGMLKGSCQKNADGSLSITLSRSSWGVNSNLSARMTEANKLEVSSFSYGMMHESGGGSGTLTS